MSGEMLQSFIESVGGQITLVVIIAVLLFAIMKLSGKEKLNTKALTLSAVLIALAFVLNQITLFRMPQGGSITPFSMLMIVLIAYFYGPRQGIMAGMAFGLLDLLINPYVIHPVQLLLDYPLAFGALGLAGLLRNKKNGLILGFIVGVFGRFICSFLSGTIFFGIYAPEGYNAITWSIVYNGTYMGTEGVITIAILLIPTVKKLFQRLKTQA